MKQLFVLLLSWLALSPAGAQTLSLDSCRAMALRSNKQLGVSRIKQQVAADVKKVAKAKHLPHVDVLGGWMLSSREISILNDDQKSALKNAGSLATGALDKNAMAQTLGQMAQAGYITPGAAQSFGQIANTMAGQLESYGNALGNKIVDAFRTDTRSIIAGSVMVNQPIYMGGAISAANEMADISMSMASTSTDAAEQTLLYTVDNAYWMVVSLNHKQKLAEKYLTLVEKLNGDVHKMIANGVATRADGLRTDVHVNEAEMTKIQVDNGLALARMYLAQICGLPLESNITLADENAEAATVVENFSGYSVESAMELRPELRLLSDVIDLSKASTKLARAAYLPQVALTAGYVISNPNVYNGYERKFGGMFTLGVMCRVPVLTWGEATYKVRAAKLQTNIASLEYEEAREKIELQVSQCDYKLKEANKKLSTARKNIQRAEENLRCANVGFQEGVMQTTDVMAAQTAWLQAQTQLVDAEIELRMSEAGMKKALGLR